MEYIITDKNGFITAHHCGANVPKNAILCPNGFAGTVGDKISDFNADFSAYTTQAIEQKQERIQQQEEELSKQNEPQEPQEDDFFNSERFKLEGYLNGTDWYVTRFTETGKPIPTDVSQKRAEYRERLSAIKESEKLEQN